MIFLILGVICLIITIEEFVKLLSIKEQYDLYPLDLDIENDIFIKQGTFAIMLFGTIFSFVMGINSLI